MQARLFIILGFGLRHAIELIFYCLFQQFNIIVVIDIVRFVVAIKIGIARS